MQASEGEFFHRRCAYLRTLGGLKSRMTTVPEAMVRSREGIPHEALLMGLVVLHYC